MIKKNKIKNQLFLIAGGTASGKTLLTEKVVSKMKKNSYILIRMDNYYKTITQLNKENVNDVNWDNPESYNWNQIISDINNLLRNEKVTGHQYNYQTGEYNKDKKFTIAPAPLIILEGIYALYNKEIRKLSNLNIFISSKNRIRKKRRIKRDSELRYKNNFDINKFQKKWKNIIIPMHKKYINPSKKYADVIIKNNSKNIDKNKKAILSIRSLMVKYYYK